MDRCPLSCCFAKVTALFDALYGVPLVHDVQVCLPPSKSEEANMPDINGVNGALDTLHLSDDSKTNSTSNPEHTAKHNDARHLIQVQTTAHEGLGVFATQPIPRGTRILCEPLLLPLNGGSDPREILHAFNALPPTSQTRFLELHPFAAPVRKAHVRKYMNKRWDQLSPHDRRIIGIYDANSFEVGVFYLPSRINHSCVPNTHYEFNPRLERGTYHAVHDIAAGEEIYISYIHGGTRVRGWRQERLDVWGFKCNCPACEDSKGGREREERRAELFGLDQKLAMQAAYGTEMSSMQALKTATRLASLLSKRF